MPYLLLRHMVGMALIVALALALSADRRAIRLRVVGPALGLQVALAGLVLGVPGGHAALEAVARGVAGLLGYAHAGVAFVFGPLAGPTMGGNSFAIAALPTIIFFATLIAILYHVGIMGLVIRWVGGALEAITGISRIEALCAAANIFVGQSEAPLVIRPYLERLAPSQLFCVMTVGLAGVAGTILAAYAAIGIRIDWLVAAAFMSAPGAIAMAKIIMPDPPGPLNEPDEGVDLHSERAANIIMAASEGAQTGVRLAVAVGAMVLAFVALVALANGVLGWVGGFMGLPGLSFQAIIGQVFAPLFWLIGADGGANDWAQAVHAGGLFGTKIALNEFVAFIDLAHGGAGLSPRMAATITFALCGFANFSSIAIQMAVTGSLAPAQRPVIARLGLKALAAGALANLMSATLAGLFVH